MKQVTKPNENSTYDPLSEVYQLMRCGDYEAALSRIITRKGDRLRAQYNGVRHEAWYAVGDCFTKLKNYKKAVNAFMHAYRARPADRDTLLAIGNCHVELNDPEFAIIYFWHICHQKKSDYEARFNLGNAYMDAGEFELAIRNFDKITDIKSDVYNLARKNTKIARKELDKTT